MATTTRFSSTEERHLAVFISTLTKRKAIKIIKSRSGHCTINFGQAVASASGWLHIRIRCSARKSTTRPTSFGPRKPGQESMTPRRRISLLHCSKTNITLLAQSGPRLEQRYYEVYNQDNVDVIALKQNPIDTFTEKGNQNEERRRARIRRYHPGHRI